jgi:Family of unknown function (DUF6335)
MAKKKSNKRKTSAKRAEDEDLDRNLAPPREATYLRSDLEREAEEHEALFTNTSPKLTGGDVDADWERAESDGEEAVGGTVATPDQDVVDDLTDAVGVPRAPDEPVRTSEEILAERDRHRWEQEQNERD